MEYYSEKQWCVKRNGREPFEVECFYANDTGILTYYLYNECCYTSVEGDMFFRVETDAILAHQTLLVELANEWWDGVDHITMHIVTGITLDDYPCTENGKLSFENDCHSRWTNMSVEEKISTYKQNK